MGFSMAELEMLPAWAGRLAESAHPPQPPTPPRRHTSEDPAGEDTASEDGMVATNGHGPSVLAGQPPLPSGEHRLEPDDHGPDPEARAAAMTTSELPVVSIPFEDETTPDPEPPAPPVDLLIDTLEVPADDAVVDAELLDDTELADEAELLDEAEPFDAELADEVELLDEIELTDETELTDEAELLDETGAGAPAGSGEAPRGEGLLDEGGQPPAGREYLDEIVYEPDEIELLEDTDPIGIAPIGTPPATAPTAAETATGGHQAEPVERRRPVVRVLSLLTLAVVVVAAGVAAGYLFVAVTGG